MQFAYICVNRNHGLAKQRESVTAFGVPEKNQYVEGKPEVGDKRPIRNWLIVRKLRPKAKDEIVVSHFDVLAENGDDLNVVCVALDAKCVVVIEASTGRRSDKRSDLVAMTHDAIDRYAGRLTASERSEIGKLGAAASPVTKERKGRMPMHEIDKILDDHSLVIKRAVAKVNADRRFKTKISLAWVYRMKRKGRLKFRARLSGRLQST
jgi:hypothetical protein